MPALQVSWSVRTKCAQLMVTLQGNLTGPVADLPPPVRYSDLVLGSQIGHSPQYIKYMKRCDYEAFKLSKRIRLENYIVC